MTRPSPQPLDLEPVAQLHQQLLVVAQIEAVSQSVEGVFRKAVLAVTAAAVDHVQVGQRRQFVAVADLEAEVAHAEVLDRFVAGHCVARGVHAPGLPRARVDRQRRSEEHTSELQSLMRISYAVFCLTKNNTNI